MKIKELKETNRVINDSGMKRQRKNREIDKLKRIKRFRERNREEISGDNFDRVKRSVDQKTERNK